MTDFHDFFINPEIDNLQGWNRKSAELKTIVIRANNWGELKDKIMEHRKEADILAFEGGEEELNLKVLEQPQMDVLLHPGKDRNDNGLDHVMAEKAQENSVKIGFDFDLLYNSEEGYRKMNEWRTNFQILEKYEADYILTTRASDEEDIRPPRDLAALIDQLGGQGRSAVNKTPQKMLENIKKRDSKIGAGVEKL